ncbi:MAG: 50S ribosomal protein L25 [Opitutae bacterium]|jgi:large subunit ribosomal protein L25|nr:50S ribosomal protein L25 [Opitutae bacterium]MBT5693054.1 50S ribosomal protein L25 [Opitutae bacterium]MBT6463496.1 50S ribosomal protein L25 [Opitutae bacterium]MBT6956962.1 50S ribosomal protein L25 [Opitutae bacterium]MBT7852823.1 50S ribosomal protein L25 [Opitutae bacterium]
MDSIILNTSKREQVGRSASRNLRAKDLIPAVIYGQGESRICSVSRKDFEELRRSAAGGASLIELKEEGGATALTLIKDVQRHAITRQFLHIDFLEVAKDREFTTTVPVNLVGESIGVKQNDGILQQQITELTVRCKPADLPSAYELDISDLDLGDSLSIKDIGTESGVAVLQELELTVVSCVGSAHGRAEAEDESEDGEEGVDGEGDSVAEESSGEAGS